MEQCPDGFSSASSFEALCSLLNNAEEEDENEGLSSTSVVNPGDIGHLGSEKKVSSALQKDRGTKEIWNVLEVRDGLECDDSLDPRVQPEYEILYKQRVGSEDIFLGMSQKDPSTACCEDMVVKIQLPNTKASDLSLDIRRKFIDLRTPKYKLGLHLPHPINENTGKAQFKVDTETLEVTLSLARDFFSFS
ncbi:dynein assembly factor 6, axonemal [Bufo bufo]|uniref:dynein assembly factor 6, axonemal n=1 Tax=Bufo bufo TaxID=8384 RepID=UPI001ABE5857|nr:dynein assembly factor 6, axonemal [Bufo bufo]